MKYSCSPTLGASGRESSCFTHSKLFHAASTGVCIPTGLIVRDRLPDVALRVGEKGESLVHAAAANFPAGVAGSTNAEVTVGTLQNVIDRKRVVEGKRVDVGVERGGTRIKKKKK